MVIYVLNAVGYASKHAVGHASGESIIWNRMSSQCMIWILDLKATRIIYIVRWEPEWHYHCSMMFCWEPEGPLLLYKVYGDGALLVWNRTSLNRINDLLVLSWRYCLAQGHKLLSPGFKQGPQESLQKWMPMVSSTQPWQLQEYENIDRSS